MNNYLLTKSVKGDGGEKNILILLGIEPLHPVFSLVPIFSELTQILRNSGKQFQTWLMLLNRCQSVGFEVLGSGYEEFRRLG
jgi:hypothetical protein